MQAKGGSIYFHRQSKPSRKRDSHPKCTALEWIRNGYVFPDKPVTPGGDPCSETARPRLLRVALWSAATVSTLVALFVSLAFGASTLNELQDPYVNFREALMGAFFVGIVVLCAWIVAIGAIISAFRPK